MPFSSPTRIPATIHRILVGTVACTSFACAVAASEYQDQSDEQKGGARDTAKDALPELLLSRQFVANVCDRLHELAPSLARKPETAGRRMRNALFDFVDAESRRPLDRDRFEITFAADVDMPRRQYVEKSTGKKVQSGESGFVADGKPVDRANVTMRLTLPQKMLTSQPKLMARAVYGAFLEHQSSGTHSKQKLKEMIEKTLDTWQPLPASTGIPRSDAAGLEGSAAEVPGNRPNRVREESSPPRSRRPLRDVPKDINLGTRPRLKINPDGTRTFEDSSPKPRESPQPETGSSLPERASFAKEAPVDESSDTAASDDNFPLAIPVLLAVAAIVAGGLLMRVRLRDRG